MRSGIFGSRQIQSILILDNHETAGSKLAAQLAGWTRRVLFDARELLRRPELDPERLRLASTAYGAMNPLDWRGIKAGDIKSATRGLDAYLRPLLRGSAGLLTKVAGWEKLLVAEVP